MKGMTGMTGTTGMTAKACESNHFRAMASLDGSLKMQMQDPELILKAVSKCLTSSIKPVLQVDLLQPNMLEGNG